MTAMDSADALLVQRRTAHVAGSCACIGTHSFYTNSGSVCGERLHALVHSAGGSSTTSNSKGSPHHRQLLGWFAYRPGLPAVPSMLDAVVCQQLQAWLQQAGTGEALAPSMQQHQHQQPLLFCLVTSQKEHNGATVSLQFRFFAYHSGSTDTPGTSSTSTSKVPAAGGAASAPHTPHPSLQPIEVHVLNLGPQQHPAAQHPALAAARQVGGGSGGGTGGSSSSSGGGRNSATPHAQPGSHSGIGAGTQRLAALAAALEMPSAAAAAAAATGRSTVEAGSGGALGGEARQRLLHAGGAAAGPGSQLAVVEEVYGSLLEQLQVAAAAASEQQGRLAALRRRNAALRRQLSAAASPTAAGGLPSVAVAVPEQQQVPVL